jgi:hypothetical protein
MRELEIAYEDFDCRVINARVRITKEITHFWGQQPLPTAMTVEPRSCSGFEKCGLFPIGRFPSGPNVGVVATGCPIIDKRMISGT